MQYPYRKPADPMKREDWPKDQKWTITNCKNGTIDCFCRTGYSYERACKYCRDERQKNTQQWQCTCPSRGLH